VPLGRPLASLAEYYRGGLRLDADPGTRFTYSNHGFATLGQLVEDVSGLPLDRYLRQHLFAPLGMADTGLARSERVSWRRATGYELRSGGARPVPDYQVVTAGGGAAWSTPADMARYAAARSAAAALAAMFAPQYQPDPRVPGFGLWGCSGPTWAAASRSSTTASSPASTPSSSWPRRRGRGGGLRQRGQARHALAGARGRRPAQAAAGRPRGDDPHRRPPPARALGELCGRYRLSAHPSDPARLAIGPRAEVVVRRGQLTLRARSPVPALRRGFPLHPDDEQDPYVFGIELPWFGVGTSRVVFSRTPGVGTTGLHLEFAPLSFHRQPPRRPWAVRT
jgi:hypothetical protein